MKIIKRILLYFTIIISLTGTGFAQKSSALYRPRLVLVLVIDQFRADYLTRFYNRFLPALQKGQVGGFRYLTERGAWFPQTKYESLQAMTASGHATILSGSNAYLNGIILNEWFDRKQKKVLSCVYDPNYTSINSTAASKQASDSSPQNFLGSTFGDELKNAGLQSKVVTIAGKPRSAILLGGHRADLALWQTETGLWTTSNFYLPNGSLPSWVEDLNAQVKNPGSLKYHWAVSNHTSGYSSLPYTGDKENKPHPDQRSAKFPYELDYKDRKTQDSPYGLKLTMDAAQAALSAYKLGQNPDTDLLAISFSSFDGVGHDAGYHSLEMEEMAIATDQEISRLLNTTKKLLPNGLKDVVILLTGDHGSAPVPEWATSKRLNAGRLDQANIKRSLEEFLVSKYGKSKQGEWIENVTSMHFYINRAAIQSQNISYESFEEEAKSYLSKTEGVFKVISSSDYFHRRLPPGMFEKGVLNSYFPERSGDLIVVPKPYFINNSYAAHHMTGYNYDTVVPLIIAGTGIIPGRYPKNILANDIAPTLAFIAGVTPPTLSEGRVLWEIFKP